MSKPKDGPAVHFEVEDAEAAFRNLENATRKIMSVPRSDLSKKPTHTTKKKFKKR